ncbi:MAG: hypothetical protein H0X41_12050 [Chitinophagaceae bacterium]|nr:hypothetical protein [Chitinophagaceae bacterium]
MTIEHPTEEALQAHVLDPMASSTAMRQHIGSCTTCQTSVSAYSTLFAALQVQPEPVFDFDVAEAVLSVLPAPKTTRTPVLYGTLLLLVTITGVPLYLFKENMATLFSGMSEFFLYVCVGSALIFLLVRIMQVIKTYQRQFDLLKHLPDLQPYSGERV